MSSGNDLTGRVINRLASEARFKLEIEIMRDDHAKGLPPQTLNNMIQKLARDYNLSPWLIRGLVEQRWNTPEGTTP